MKMKNCSAHKPDYTRYDLRYNGTVFDKQEDRLLQYNDRYEYYLADKTGKKRFYTLKELYRDIYNKEFAYDSIQNIDGEVWKPIKGTKDRYFISNKGRVKSYCHYKARLLKQSENNKGYYRVDINGKRCLTHRLVARAFIPNDDKTKDTIDHIDNNKHNNNSNNLQWMTRSENSKKGNKKEQK